MNQWTKIILFGLIFLSTPWVVQSAEIEFNIDPSYDYLGRTKINAFLHQLGENVYFYVEDDFYQTLDIEEKKEFSDALRNLSQEFDVAIYPKLRELFGSEWNPGIDNDKKITVLITRIKGESGGYFNSGDEYPKIQNPNSNEREMVYLNSNYITGPLLKGFLAHEFVHLITFYQKEKIRGASEDIWLNEARSEAAITYLGYDQQYQGSNLQRRVRAFLQKTQDPLTEWKNESPDYGVINLFSQYLIDHYGIKILSDSMKSEKVGIASLNEALKKQGFPQDFPQIFTDWTITLLVNDCSLGPKYCYLNENLKNLRVLPQLNYLPLVGESTLQVTNYIKNWSGNWYKFIGGQGTLKLEFIGDQNVKFKVPYLLEDSAGKYSLGYLELNSSQRSTTYFADFGKKTKSLIIIPSIQSKISGFGSLEPFYQFIFSSSIIAENPERIAQEELIKNLLSQIDSLKSEIARVQLEINTILAKSSTKIWWGTCQKLENNLYFGIQNNLEVRCLQEFLKNQGKEIYPEGLITGNFLTLTELAVIRFQEKYAQEILAPLGLARGTGFVGSATRAKINQLLKL